ncbi:MAG: glycosyltransferase family 9 protein [Candidatus Omnitrophica bacterium]|nr:glycosyltransferase family 9 protein [Candidatus Omnitrophota bacterium]
MKITSMRKLDYWVGIPLCIFLSGINYIPKMFPFKKKEKDRIKRALFIKLSELGAIILSYPLLRRIKEEYSLEEIFFITFKKNQEVFKLLRGIIPTRNILVIREDSIWIFLFDTLKIIGRLRREKIDIVFDLEFFSRFSALLVFFIKADMKIGLFRYTYEGLYRGDFLTHKIQYNPLNHISKTYLSLAQSIKKESQTTPNLDEQISDKEIIFQKYESKTEIKSRMQRKLEKSGINSNSKLFLISPGEGVLPLREWPLENFILLSRWILDGVNNYIVIVGTEGVAAKGELLLKALNTPKSISLIGQTTLEELMELFNLSDALISNDCGLAHLAMLTSIKKFIIFGPESPHVFGPLGDNNWIIYSGLPCSPCLSILNHRNSSCTNNICLKMISPENVYKLVTGSLNIS